MERIYYIPKFNKILLIDYNVDNNRFEFISDMSKQKFKNISKKTKLFDLVYIGEL